MFCERISYFDVQFYCKLIGSILVFKLFFSVLNYQG